MKQGIAICIMAAAFPALAQEAPTESAAAAPSETSAETPAEMTSADTSSDAPAESTATQMPADTAPADNPAPAETPEAAAAASAAETIAIPEIEKDHGAVAISPPLAAPEENGSIRLDDIVVTATKRSKSVREIPASINAQSGEDLERRNAQGAQDILKTVPGVNITPDPINGLRISIRGISTGALSNPTAGSLFGDVSFTDSYVPRVTLDPNPFDMQSVEVLKGPQGTLFGAAALNGAIRYVPEPPQLGTFAARYFAQYSWVSQGGAAPVEGAVVNVPVGDEAAVRVMAFDRRAPGYVDDLKSGQNDVNTLHQQGLRGIADWQPGSWDVKATYAWQNIDSPDVAYADNTDGRLSNNFETQPSPSRNQYALGQLDVRDRFDWGDIVSESAYVRKTSYKTNDESRLFETSFPVLTEPDSSHSETWSQELRFASAEDPSARWSWITGLYYSHQQMHLDTGYSITTLPGLPVSTIAPLLDALLPGLSAEFDPQGRLSLLRVLGDVLVEEKALFADVTRRLGDDWELGLGARYYMTTSGGVINRTGALVAAGGALAQQLNDTVQEHGLNPKASLLWRASKNVSAYAAISRGFRVGGIQPGFTSAGSAHQAPDVFKSDMLWNYEGGLRTQWLDNTLRADITGFFIDWQNAQLLQNSTLVPIPYLDNVGGVHSYGTEATLQWLIPWLPGLKASASGSWSRTETSKLFVASDGSDVPAGTSWPYAPQWQSSSTLDYSTAIGDWAINGSVTHTFMGQALSDLQNHFPVFGYRQWDLLLGVANTTYSWLPSMTLTVNNLTDERGIANGGHGGLAPVSSYVEAAYIQPRTITLRLEGRFE